MLQYVLCASRFAHYLKVLARDKVGSFTEAADFERFLSRWVSQYVTPDDQASAETRARMPLRAAAVEVREEPGTAGVFRVVMRLQPHFQIDRLDATLKLVSTVRRSNSR
jgi:type VI secretion system ImpC/EvpB family protein